MASTLVLLPTWIVFHLSASTSFNLIESVYISDWPAFQIPDHLRPKASHRTWGPLAWFLQLGAQVFKPSRICLNLSITIATVSHQWKPASVIPFHPSSILTSAQFQSHLSSEEPGQICCPLISLPDFPNSSSHLVIFRPACFLTDWLSKSNNNLHLQHHH